MGPSGRGSYCRRGDTAYCTQSCRRVQARVGHLLRIFLANILPFGISGQESKKVQTSIEEKRDICFRVRPLENFDGFADLCVMPVVPFSAAAAYEIAQA